MAENLDVLNTTVSVLIRALLPGVQLSRHVRQPYLKRLTSRDVDAETSDVLLTSTNSKHTYQSPGSNNAKNCSGTRSSEYPKTNLARAMMLRHTNTRGDGRNRLAVRCRERRIAVD